MAESLEFEWDTHNLGHLAMHRVRAEEAEQALEGNVMDLEHRRAFPAEGRIMIDVEQRTTPHFATEADEAAWWYEQRDRFTAEANESLTRGKLTLRKIAPPVNAAPGSVFNYDKRF